MQWFLDAKFGMFIHWGPVSQMGGDLSWSRGGEKRGWKADSPGYIPVDVYDNLYKTFNPVDYDPVKWVAVAKAAGMKYIVFTTKHHDGFSMFDTKYSDYKITSPESPYRKDIVAALAKACHDAGIKLGFYYSQPDWHNPDFLSANHSDYLKYMKNQLKELCTNYGEVDVIWFDGILVFYTPQTGVDFYGSEQEKTWDTGNVFKMLRTLQPGILINNRCGVPADFDTPEQEIGRYQLNRPWESCITIGTQWGYKKDDKVKSTEECVQTLVRCAAGGGNLLLNVGPSPEGTFDPLQTDRLKEIGEWLKVNGESVYGTRGGPVPPQSWGVTTQKNDRIFVHILDKSVELIGLPDVNVQVKSANMLDGSPVEFAQTSSGIIIKVPDKKDSIDTIVVLNTVKTGE